jgi:uncharacterized membrane protein SpoIIM required for sporulation
VKETAFIAQNEQKWKEFEQLLDGQAQSPEKLNELFVQVMDDLSYARTFYPNRSVRVYLNGLAQKLFFNIYKNKKSRRSRFVAFWLDDLPYLLYEARRELLLSFVVFALATAIGMLSCAAEPDFLRIILGDAYVEMTEENIRSGDPMAVYKQKGEFNMFLGITLNNIMVAFYTFILGLFYAIGTLGILLRNGIMFGAFQYFFIDKGLFQESFLTVWMHGAFELSSIVVAGAAGLTMGRGLVFPGTLSRLRSFQLSARRGMSIMIGIVPLFVAAGFIESYLTRYTEAPDALRAVFIFLCLFFMLFYFVLYPRMRVKAMADFGMEPFRLSPDADRGIDYEAIKTTGDIFTDAFIFYKKYFKKIAPAALAGAVFYCAGAFLLAKSGLVQLFIFDEGMFGTLPALPSFFANEHHPWLFPFTTGAMALVAFPVHYLLAKESEEAALFSKREAGAAFLKALVVAALLNLVVLTLDWYTLMLIMLFFPVLFLYSQVMVSEKSNFITGLGKTFSLINGATYGPMLGLMFTLTLFGTLFFLILDTGVMYFLLDFILLNFSLSPEKGQVLATVLVAFITVFVLLLIFALWAVGCGLQYFSLAEVYGAAALKERLGQIGKKERIKGLEREG